MAMCDIPESSDLCKSWFCSHARRASEFEVYTKPVWVIRINPHSQ